MTLDAGVGRLNIVEAGGVKDRSANWSRHMLAARSMTLFAADVPFADFFGRRVVVDGMAPVAERARRSLEVIWGIQRRPPVSIVRHEIPFPHFVRDVPVCGLWEIVVAY